MTEEVAQKRRGMSPLGVALRGLIVLGGGAYLWAHVKQVQVIAPDVWAMQALSSVPHVQKLLPKEALSAEQMLEGAAREYRLPFKLLLAVAHQESGESLRLDRMRYEPRLRQLGGFPKPPSHLVNESERRLWWSSHGLLQVVWGFHAESCNIHSHADFYTQRGVNCGAKVLRDCLDRWGDRRGSEKLKLALICYNGSEAYAKQVIERFAGLVAEDL